MSREAFEQFRRVVLQDAGRQAKLQEPLDFRGFIPVALKMGEELGLAFTAEDIEAARTESHRVWIERWL